MQEDLDYAALNATERAIVEYLAIHHTPGTPFQTKDVVRLIRAADNGRCIAKNYANYIPTLAQSGWLESKLLGKATHYKRYEYSMSEAVANTVKDRNNKKSGSAGSGTQTLHTDPTSLPQDTALFLMERHFSRINT